MKCYLKVNIIKFIKVKLQAKLEMKILIDFRVIKKNQL